MAHITKEELDRYRAVQQGGTQLTSSDQVSHLTYSEPSVKPHIRNRIYDAVYHAGCKGGRLSRNDIAKALKLKPSPWLRDHIDKLVAEGYLVRLDSTGRNGKLKYLYGVA